MAVLLDEITGNIGTNLVVRWLKHRISDSS